MNDLTDEQFKDFVLFYRKLTDPDYEIWENRNEYIDARDDYYEVPWESAAKTAYLFHEYLKQKGL